MLANCEIEQKCAFGIGVVASDAQSPSHRLAVDFVGQRSRTRWTENWLSSTHSDRIDVRLVNRELAMSSALVMVPLRVALLIRSCSRYLRGVKAGHSDAAWRLDVVPTDVPPSLLPFRSRRAEWQAILPLYHYSAQENKIRSCVKGFHSTVDSLAVVMLWVP